VKRQPEYLTLLLEQLSPLGALRARAMFGGYGLYCDELFFAIVVDEILYLKADSESKSDFEMLGLLPFSYAMKDGRLQTMAYYPLPDVALDDDAALQQWAKKGIAAALRARNKPAGRRKSMKNQA
jgi:DNA transformation protein and related proteins